MKTQTSIQLIFLFIILLTVQGCSCNRKSQKNHDNEAVMLLQKIGEAVQSSKNKSFTIIIDEEKIKENGKVYSEHSECNIKALYPNKFFVDGIKDQKPYNYFYDGEYFTYYSKVENNYITLNAPPTTAEMIDSLHNAFGFKFPAGDFFYPSFEKDIQKYFNVIDVRGSEMVEGIHCTKLYAENADYDVNLWMDAQTFLPKRLTIIYKKENNIEYESTFRNWDLSTNFNDSIFSFVAPENAHLIDIMAKGSKTR